VIAVPYGFRYQGKIYRSLTAIAREITERWSWRWSPAQAQVFLGPAHVIGRITAPPVAVQDGGRAAAHHVGDRF
jgi:hypothetical protein